MQKQGWQNQFFLCWVAALVTPIVCHGADRGVTDSNTWTNNIPPRLQWEANYGYCGEVSLISAGLYYGQYLSQYDARAIASRDKPQSHYASQLLLGVNDKYAASQMHLEAIEWNYAKENNTNSFLQWVKENVVAGYSVAIGIYMNQWHQLRHCHYRGYRSGP
ncbi:MAG TPA: hypothetical protein VF020_15315 [Chthoniobacterales bacterium]